MAAYLANGQNGTEAAKTAGYAPKSAHVTASRLLKNPKIAQALAASTQRALQGLELTTENVLRALAGIVHFDPRKLYHTEGEAKGKLKSLAELDDDTAKAIASIEFEDGAAVRVRGFDKNVALAHAMRYLGLMKPEMPLVPPSPGPVHIHAQNVAVLSPMDSYKLMLSKSASALPR